MTEESSQPFSEGEIAIILDAADRTYRRGHDLDWVGQLVRFFLNYGPHPSVAAGGDSVELYIDQRPKDDGTTEWFLVWNRPKTHRKVTFPIPDDDRPWIEGFLRVPRPRTPSGYWRIFQEVADHIDQGPHRIHLNARRFRHTCAVRLKRAGIWDTDIASLLAVTPRTLEIYARRTPEEMAQVLRSKGWGSSARIA